MLRVVFSGVVFAMLTLWILSGASTGIPEAHAQEAREFKYSARVQSAYFQYMYDEGDTIEDAKARISKTLDMAEAAGVNTIDVQVAWAGVDLGDYREEHHGDGDKFRGRYIWDRDIYGHENNHLDNILRESQKRGFEVNLQIEATPDWVHPYLKNEATNCGTPSASTYCSYDYRFWHPPRGEEELAHFGNFMADLAGHVEGNYPGLIGHYKIWNEPNNQPFWAPSLGEESPGEYVELLRAAHLAVKGVDMEANVSFGGISLNNHGYLREYYEAARKAYPEEAEERGYFFDVLEVHPYVYPDATHRGSQSPDLYEQGLAEKEFANTDHFTGEEFDYIGEVNGNFLGFEEMKEVMDAEEGGSDKSLYIGEFGYRVPHNVSDERRALYLKRAYDLARGYDFVEGMAWFTFHQNGGWQTDELDWTTLGRDFEPSLTYRALEQVTGAKPANVKLAAVVSESEAGGYEVEPRLENLSLDAVRRWEFYVDGKLVKAQTGTDISWQTTDARAHEVMLAAYADDGSVWHSTPKTPDVNAEPPKAEPPKVEPPKVAPEIVGTSPARGAKIRGRSAKIRARIEDRGTLVSKRDIRLSVDGRRVSRFKYNVRTGRLTHVSRNLRPGTHVVRMNARNADGQNDRAVWRFKVLRK